MTVGKNKIRINKSKIHDRDITETELIKTKTDEELIDQLIRLIQERKLEDRVEKIRQNM